MQETLQQPIKEIAQIIRKYHLSYDQSRYIFRQARQMAELKPPKNRKKGTVTRLSKDELETFLVESYKQSAIIGLMMQTLYETAARVSEFVNLQPDDIYTTDQVIVVRSGKGNKRREIPVDQGLPYNYTSMVDATAAAAAGMFLKAISTGNIAPEE